MIPARLMMPCCSERSVLNTSTPICLSLKSVMGMPESRVEPTIRVVEPLRVASRKLLSSNPSTLPSLVPLTRTYESATMGCFSLFCRPVATLRCSAFIYSSEDSPSPELRPLSTCVKLTSTSTEPNWLPERLVTGARPRISKPPLPISTPHRALPFLFTSSTVGRKVERSSEISTHLSPRLVCLSRHRRAKLRAGGKW